MKATIKVGRQDGMISSYNLILGSGLRLKTDDLTWLAIADREKIRQQFQDTVTVLRAGGWEIEETEGA